MTDLVGISEIADRVGVKPDTVRKWRQRHSLSFPDPVARLAIGDVWDWADVAAWVAVPRGAGRPSKGGHS